MVVTDGESHDGEELPAALKACEAGRVTRYGIAVRSGRSGIMEGVGMVTMRAGNLRKTGMRHFPDISHISLPSF